MKNKNFSFVGWIAMLSFPLFLFAKPICVLVIAFTFANLRTLIIKKDKSAKTGNTLIGLSIIYAMSVAISFSIGIMDHFLHATYALLILYFIIGLLMFAFAFQLKNLKYDFCGLKKVLVGVVTFMSINYLVAASGLALLQAIYSSMSAIFTLVVIMGLGVGDAILCSVIGIVLLRETKEVASEVS